MTENEAKKKWCPFARAIGPGGKVWTPPHNRLASNHPYAEGTHCIGSACMAWRTAHQWLDNARQNPRWVDYEPYAFTPGDGQERDGGYCGLAGRPT